MADKNPNWGGARPGAGRRSMAYQLDREQWETVISALQASGDAGLADELQAWLTQCDMAWENFRLALSKVKRRTVVASR